MLPLVYQTADQKIIAAAKLMQDMPDYAKDIAVEDVSNLAKLVTRAKENGTDG